MVWVLCPRFISPHSRSRLKPRSAPWWAARPTLARVFEQLGLDFCCGGKQSLAVACGKLGLDATTVVALLEAAVAAGEAGPAEVDAAAMTLSELADHIEQTHHR